MYMSMKLLQENWHLNLLEVSALINSAINCLGKTSSVISWIQFSQDNKFLMLVNEKGTLHIFNLDEKNRIRNSDGNEGIFSTIANYVRFL